MYSRRRLYRRPWFIAVAVVLVVVLAAGAATQGRLWGRSKVDPGPVTKAATPKTALFDPFSPVSAALALTGGVVVAGPVRLTFPAGSLSGPATVSVSEAKPRPLGKGFTRRPAKGGAQTPFLQLGNFIDVHVSAAKVVSPVRVDVRINRNVLPTGLVPQRLFMTHLADNGRRDVLRTRYSPATQTLTASAPEFSNIVIEALLKGVTELFNGVLDAMFGKGVLTMPNRLSPCSAPDGYRLFEGDETRERLDVCLDQPEGKGGVLLRLKNMRTYTQTLEFDRNVVASSFYPEQDPKRLPYLVAQSLAGEKGALLAGGERADLTISLDPGKATKVTAVANYSSVLYDTAISVVIFFLKLVALQKGKVVTELLGDAPELVEKIYRCGMGLMKPVPEPSSQTQWRDVISAFVEKLLKCRDVLRLRLGMIVEVVAAVSGFLTGAVRMLQIGQDIVSGVVRSFVVAREHQPAPPPAESSASSCMSTHEFVDAMTRIDSVAQLGPAEPGTKVVCESFLAASDPVIAGQRQFIVLVKSEDGWNGDGPAGGPLTPEFCTSLQSDPVIWDFVREGC